MYFLIAILPLAVYLLILAMINRRPRALMVSGPWDFLGVIFALSGFLCLGGPVLLTSLNERARRFWILGKKDGPLIVQDDQYLFWVFLFVGYFILVVAGSAFLLWRRRRFTAIYNVDHDVFGQVLGEVLVQKQIAYEQIGNMLFLRADSETTKPVDPGQVVMEVEPSPRFRHLTLCWDPPDSLLRREIEIELEKELEEIPAPHNSAGDWLMVISGLLFLGWLIGFGLVAMFWIFQR